MIPIAAIRAYVKAVRLRRDVVNFLNSIEDLDVWGEWALAQADKIDPVLSRSFLKRTNDTDEPSN